MNESYHKVKCAHMEVERIQLHARVHQLEAQIALMQQQAAFRQVLTDAGLDPAQDYALSDADESITARSTEHTT